MVSYLKKMKKQSKNLLFIVVLVVTAFAFVQCKDTAKQASLEVMAKTLNTQCPRMLTPSVRLEKCEAMPDQILQLDVTLINIDGAGIPAQEMTAVMKPALVKAMKTNAEFDKVRNAGFSFQYTFSDKNGIFMSNILITPDDYNNP